MQLRPFALLPLALLIQGCAGFGTRQPEPTSLLDSIPRVDNSPKSPCWQQQQIAAQNTAIDTALKKTSQTYKAPCDIDPKPKQTAAN